MCGRQALPSKAKKFSARIFVCYGGKNFMLTFVNLMTTQLVQLVLLGLGKKLHVDIDLTIALQIVFYLCFTCIGQKPMLMQNLIMITQIVQFVCFTCIEPKTYVMLTYVLRPPPK